ncbi:chromosome partitioning protein [Nocardioides sp. GY 10113]|uniref:AAA family ATPase n=1 Tax=Nocardioides sp. GY 10113 TaxID=2569761 RepID=UPI0010A8E0FE|nr:chromosome partitioning protein [Nocardioides sp. GY 10113]TIC87341.1 chromosome partitioning protein [Nocardioides sp. GY 10113]
MIVALLVSTGASWEAAAFGALNAHPGIVVLKRCVDVADLLATASTGQAEVAVAHAQLTALDASVLAELERYGVRVVAVADDPGAGLPAVSRAVVRSVVPAGAPDELVAAVLEAPAPARAVDRTPAAGDEAPGDEQAGAVAAGPPEAPGPVLAVWGPAGAPGRSTLAVALAAELARRGRSTLLVDADPYGGTIAQQLGVMDEVSGILAAARLSAAGGLAPWVATVERTVSERLRVVTGLPRADRWTEVRPDTVAQLVEAAASRGAVVLDTGFSLEVEPGVDPLSRPARNGLTLEALEVADEVVAVGAADPVGLARLARGLSELRDRVPGVSVRVVVNRMRPSLGWRERDVAAMLAGFGAERGVHFVPEDQAALDRALVAGRTPVEVGESALTRSVAALVEEIAGSAGRASAPPVLRR